MVKPVFKSSFTMEEIERKFEDADFFSGVMEGLEDALAHAKATKSAETHTYNRPPNYQDDAAVSQQQK